MSANNDLSRFPNHSRKLPFIFFCCLFLLFLIGFYLSLRYGAKSFDLFELMNAIPLGHSDSKHSIFFDIRLPRVLASLLVGAALATSGLIMQAITRNPIADPGLLGINSGAALFLAIGYALFHSLHYISILGLCLLGSFVATLLVFSLSYQKTKGYQSLRLILSGAMISMLFSAIGQALMNAFQLSSSIIGWQAGGLVGTNWKMLILIGPVIVISLLLAQFFSYHLNILALNEQSAKALGQKTGQYTFFYLFLVLLLSSSAVAIAGNIAFVGLIVPHLIRPFMSRDFRYLIPITALGGATFMVWIDFISRNLNAPYETPISAIIGIICLPVFLIIIKRRVARNDN